MTRGLTAFEAIAFFNFIALYSSGGRRYRKRLVYLDKQLLGPPAQHFVANRLCHVIDYNANHAQTVFVHYENEYPNLQAVMGDDDILAREYRWDWFQVKYDELFKLTKDRTRSMTSEQYATALTDVLLNVFLAMKSLNDFERLTALREIPENGPSVTHIGNDEIAGYELLFNSIFRLRIGWEKFARLLVIFYGQDPGRGFSVILKSFTRKLSMCLSAESKPLLDALDEHANGAIVQIERLRNDEEHNSGVIVRSLGDRVYLQALHGRVHSEFKRYQIAVTSGLALLLAP